MTLPLHLNDEGIVDGFKYEWRDCVKTFAWVCTRWELKKRVFLFSNQVEMKTFYDMDRVLTGRQKL